MTSAVARALPVDFETEIRIGSHRVVADATPETGGQGRGPEPHDLLAAALASCTAVTLRMYAKRKGWELPGLEVMVEQEKDGAGGTVFRRALLLPPGLELAQRERLVQIANACPVHRILSGTIRIETAAVGGLEAAHG